MIDKTTQQAYIVINEMDCRYALMDDYNKLEEGALSEEEIHILVQQSKELNTLIPTGEKNELR